MTLRHHDGVVQHQGRPGGPWIDYAITSPSGGPIDGHVAEVIYDDPAGADLPDTATSYIGTDGLRHDVVDEEHVRQHWAKQGHEYPAPNPHVVHAEAAAKAHAGTDDEAVNVSPHTPHE